MMNIRLIKILLIFTLSLAVSCTSTKQEDPDFAEALSDAETDLSQESASGDALGDSGDEEELALDDALGDGEEAADANSQTAEADEIENSLEENLAETDTVEGTEEFQEAPLEQAQTAPPAEPEVDNSFESEMEQAPIPPVAQNAKITNIEFRSNESGGTIVISASSPVTYTSRLNADKSQFVIEVENSNLPESLKRPFIMKDFGTKFKAINAYQTPGSNISRIVVQLASAFTPVVSQEGSRIILVPTDAGQSVVANNFVQQQPIAQVAAPSEVEDTILSARTLDEFLTENSRFYGKPISIEFSKEADVRDIINFIAEESGANIVMSEEVAGQLSIKLRRVPWDQALVIVMRSKSLGYVRQGNVIRISTLKQLQDEANSAKAIIEAQKMLAPQRVKVIPVSFAKVEDIVTQLKPFLTDKQGQAVADARTSTLIITDTEEKISKVSKLIRELDIPPAQVMIEGKFVEAQERFTRQVGINWSLSGSAKEISATGGANGSPISFTPTLNIQNQAAVLPAFGVNVGILDLLGDLNATLALAESDNLVKVISSPRIVTINKEVAEIKQSGQVISLSSIENNGAVTKRVERSPVVLNLKVTPQITNDGSVIMDLEVKREFPGSLEDPTTLARAINSREAKTKVLVQNGQTAVIGGIYTNDQSNNESGIPVLKDIPVLGWLFKGQSTEKSKNELLIFLTPRILNIKDQQAQVDSNAKFTN